MLDIINPVGIVDSDEALGPLGVYLMTVPGFDKRRFKPCWCSMTQTFVDMWSTSKLPSSRSKTWLTTENFEKSQKTKTLLANKTM